MNILSSFVIPAMPLFFIYGPWYPAVPGSFMPVKQSVVWKGDISRGTMGASSQYPRPSIPTSKTDNILSYKTHLRNIHTMMGWVCVFFFYSVLPVASLASLKAYIIFCLGGSGKRDKTLYHKTILIIMA